ncbi:flagellar hook protein FlgE [Jeotgalibacillus campisalis]|uniref:Flagellar hook protein FlgE n=1 Tax=Jeotgalibacillus campisalis TaxID=220754 RepID=A0A0C2VUP1_9BACL|nr:flagellar hook protein FlgE [Jeotgalibacillus campisalis]KIL47723.1 flagellar hook protein [Jeotgalibacillus campisalis]
MIRSMYSGIAGLKNFQTKLDVIGNNIANVNTYGFKKGRVTFQEAMNQTIQGASGAGDGRGGKNSLQVGLGSVTATIDSVQTQASLQTTGRSLDLAVNGDGFFVVQGPGGQNLFTRGGNFYLDQGGTMVTGDGYRVQQFQNGVLSDISINSGAVLPAQTTNQITLSGNLPNNVADPDFSFSQQMKVVDDQGIEHVLEVEMTANGANSWNVAFRNNSMESANNETTGTIQFNAAGVAAWNPAPQNLRVERGTPPVAGNFALAAPPVVEGLTNNPGEITTQVQANGNLSGSLESFSVSNTGLISGVYSNGVVTPMAELSLANFNNPSGLVKFGNNLFQESVNSGVANIGDVETVGSTISSGTLEMSNVDLSEEFTEMISAQRGFQANTRIITTSDQILEELVNLKR